jgi:hypothetical protein
MDSLRLIKACAMAGRQSLAQPLNDPSQLQHSSPPLTYPHPSFPFTLHQLPSVDLKCRQRTESCRLAVQFSCSRQSSSRITNRARAFGSPCPLTPLLSETSANRPPPTPSPAPRDHSTPRNLNENERKWTRVMFTLPLSRRPANNPRHGHHPAYGEADTNWSDKPTRTQAISSTEIVLMSAHVVLNGTYYFKCWT